MLSLTHDYALRAMLVLSRDASRVWKRHEIALATKVPSDYLSKILQNLSKAHLVKSLRGVQGGYSALQDPKLVNILSVVNAVDPIKRISHCPIHLKSHVLGLCPLHKKLDSALATMEDAFRSTTLWELIEEPLWC